MVRITILYDNYTTDPRFEPGWGFSCIIRRGDLSILFDTGGSGEVLLRNMGVLGIDPASIDAVFISHDHWDHTGGLGAVLTRGDGVLFVPEYFHAPSWKGTTVRVGGADEIMPGVYSSGTLMDFEQSLFLATPRGAVAVTGCSHPGVEAILAACPCPPVRALVGGLHGFCDFSLIGGLDLVCPTHCTAYRDEMIRLYPGRCVSGGVGEVFEFD